MEKEDLKILVVDDEEWILSTFKSTIESWGYKVDCALDGEIALEMCARHSYPVIITDLNMPNMDGMTFLRRIKSRLSMVEIIIVTGYATIKNAIEAMKEGASEFILKPVNFEQVRLTVKKSFQKIKAYQENEDLRTLNHQLSQLYEMKDKFLSITNHELRTPLTIINGYLEIIESMIQSPDEDLREILTILRRTAKELLSAMERLYILSRSQKNQWTFRTYPVDTVVTLQKLYEQILPLFQHRHIELSIYTPEYPIVIQTNPSNLKLILHELLHNALKYTPDGGKVTARLYTISDEIVYEVQDNGIGIPYEKQDLIFSDFYEVQDTINHKSSQNEFMGGGMGIGLSLVKEMVMSMNGRITIESEPGLGSTFRINLPGIETKSERDDESLV